MMLIFKIFACLCLLMLSACNSQETKLQVTSFQVAQVDLSQVLWWEKMHDPVLNDLIASALSNNNQLLAAKANVLQAQAQLKAAYSAWLPTVNASVNGFLIKGWDTNIKPQGALASTPIFTSLSNLRLSGGYTGFLPDYSLNLLENINNDRLAKASLAMQRASYLSLRLSIISQTAGAYFSLLGQRQQLHAQENLIRDLQKLRHLEDVRHKDGASDYSAMASVDQELANNRASMASLQSSIRQVENTLQLLINHDPGPIVTHKKLDSLNIKNIIPAHLPAQVLGNRPDLMIAKENLIMSDAQLGLAYARFFPQISLTGLLGGSSAELVHLLKITTGLGFGQLAAAMPVFNSAFYQQIQATKAGVKVEYYNYLQTLRAALVDVDNNLTKYKRARETYNYQLQAYNAAHRGARILEARYRAGYQDRRVAMNARITLDQAQLTLIQVEIEQFNALVDAYQALAAGYKPVITVSK